MSETKKTFLPFALFALILSGEAIFILPFVLSRVFRPTLLEVFNLTNLELGFIFSFYGVIAMISYFFGGPLADKFPARNLIVAALLLTAFGGFYMYTIPNYTQLKMLFGFWGFTTIFLFWAAMIKATREIGGDNYQGLAFSFLDGGRGLVSAIIGSITVVLFSFFLPVDVANSTFAEKTIAFKYVILFIVGIIILISFLVYLLLPNNSQDYEKSQQITFAEFKKLIQLPNIWLQAIIIVCAYTGYKALGDFSLYAKEVLLFDEVKSAHIGSLVLWIRPITALIAGIIALKVKSIQLINISFVLMMFGCLLLASNFIGVNSYTLFLMALVSTSAGVFALRSLYFAILKEAKIPLLLTGSAVGLISLVGYTPDIFMGPLMGHLLDNNPGIKGHQYLFLCLAIFAFIGFVASVTFSKMAKNNN